MNDIVGASIEQLSRDYASGDQSPVDVMTQTLERIEELNPSLNAIAWCDPDNALQLAEDSAQRWENGKSLGPLDGIPVTVKDAIDLKGTQSTFGSAMYADVPVATRDSPPAARLKEAGALIFAKTTAPDSGMAITGLSSLYGVVRNPWNLEVSPGGSSAGAAAALAAGIGSVAVGTDLAGSVRVPAARCGLVALKPTQGRVAHTPPNTVRSPGAMGRSVADVVALHQVIGQPDRADTFSLPAETRSYQGPLTGADGLRIGLVLDLGCGAPAEDAVLGSVHRAAEVLASLGASIHLVPRIFDKDPLAALERTFQIRLCAEMEAFGGSRDTLVLPELAEWAAGAEHLSATDSYRAHSEVTQAQIRVQQSLDLFDYVLAPVVPDARLAAEQPIDPTHPFMNAGYTAWFNQTGQPAASVCFGMADGLPIGIQIVGRRFDDWGVLSLAGLLERERSFELDWPVSPHRQL
ncbi:MAG: amidase family protein [Corynebacterium sp.]|uniref:amidase family protein n=1 Tax=Corynebacterium sp. TaxID=1720 RepID=UPI0026DFA7CF|nr:amidase family protein [Corynebacterium sp.]MDO5670747.1 amidase family protein [Corynebacterium sp.]